MTEDGSENAKPLDRFVLDSFALLAYFGDEPGAEEIERILVNAAESRAHIWIPVISLGETLYITEREQSLQSAQIVLAAVDQLPVTVVDADRALTLEAAHIKAHRAVSYADAFVVALAQQHGARVVTGDPEFKMVEDLVSVYWLERYAVRGSANRGMPGKQRSQTKGSRT